MKTECELLKGQKSSSQGPSFATRVLVAALCFSQAGNYDKNPSIDPRNPKTYNPCWLLGEPLGEPLHKAQVVVFERDPMRQELIHECAAFLKGIYAVDPAEFSCEEAFGKGVVCVDPGVPRDVVNKGIALKDLIEILKLVIGRGLDSKTVKSYITNSLKTVKDRIDNLPEEERIQGQESDRASMHFVAYEELQKIRADIADLNKKGIQNYLDCLISEYKKAIAFIHEELQPEATVERLRKAKPYKKGPIVLVTADICKPKRFFDKKHRVAYYPKDGKNHRCGR